MKNIQVDFLHDFVRVKAADEEGNEAAGQGDGSGLQSEVAVYDEACDGQCQDCQGTVENLSVFNGRRNIDSIDFFLAHVLGRQFLPEHEKDADKRCCDNDQHDWSQIDQEVVEVEVRSGTDHDVWRVADHEGCTTDVAHQDFRNKDRYGNNVKHTTKRNRHRRNQEGCRDGVNHSRTHCGDEREQDEQLSWRPFGHFHRPQSQQTEETGFLDDGNQDHHAAQKTDCIEVNELFDGFILRNIAAVEHRTAAEHGADRTRNLF